MQTSSPKNLRREPAARYLEEVHGLPVTPQALAKMAVKGGGPVFRKFGKFPIYGVDDLDRYAQECLSPPMRSTAELPAHARRRTSGRKARS